MSEAVFDEAAGTLTIPLPKPLKTPDGDVMELVLRELTLEDIEGMSFGAATTGKEMTALISKATGIPPAFIKKVSLRVLGKHAEAIGDFFGG